MEKGKGTRELWLARVRRRLAIFPFLFSMLLLQNSKIDMGKLADRPSPTPPRGAVRSSLAFRFSIFVLLLFLSGCASPGEPIERRPPVPTAIEDLSAEQSGNTVVLTFTLPRETAERRPLKQPPGIEIYRGFSGASASPAPATESKSPALLVTIPSAMVSHYAERGRIVYTDVLRPEDLSEHPNEVASYMVRTRASAKESSANSNVVGVRVSPAAEPIGDLKAQVAHSTVKLIWTPPEKTPIGSAPPIKTYRIYRAELANSVTPRRQSGTAPKQTPESPQTSGSSAEPQSMPPLTKIGESQSASYDDSQVEFGHTYTYAVRSVVEYSGEEVESSDSNLASVTVRDIVPPAAPQGLVVVFVPAEGETPAHLELSWGINPETDIAGYNVYRSEGRDELGTRVNPELLPTPAFRDMSAVAGQAYFYTVTAVDRSGNESSRSAPVSGEVPAEGQPKP